MGFLKELINSKIIRKRLIIIIVLLIFIPLILNMIFLYHQNVELLKEERVRALEQTLYKSSQTISYEFISLQETIREIANNNSSNASLYRYNSLEDKYKVRLDDYLHNILVEAKKKNKYIESLFFLSNSGELFSSEDEEIEITKLLDKDILESFSQNKNQQKWIYNKNNDLTVINKLSYVLPEAIIEKNGLQGRDRVTQTGLLLGVIKTDDIRSLYNDIPMMDLKDIVIYDNNDKIVYNRKVNYKFTKEIDSTISSSSNIETKEFHYDNEKLLLGTSKIEGTNELYLSIIQSLDPISKKSRVFLIDNFILLIFVGLLLALWIISELLFFSKLISDKEITSYKLNIAEDTNTKLRMYKHDFFNQLQIIQGLVEMKENNKAKQYIKDIVKEGTLITKEYKVGIPEIEAVIYSAVNKAKKNNIDVDLDLEKLPHDINIDIYDLSKILTNLLKNSIEALKNTDETYKLLKIEIKEQLGNYIFSVYNNKPLIKESIKDRIFEKNYSTNTKKGRGLGLYIVKKLIEKNNGNIELIIKDGNYFIVKFPVE